ncbi:IS91 family transposase [Planctomycetota bacterium]
MSIPTPIFDRPQYCVGDIFRKYGDEYKATHAMSPQQRKVFRNVSRCRTSALGGHLYECGHGCGYEVPAYNCCQDRHCPMCQGIAMRKWLDGRMEELLAVPYFHTVFTVSHGFNVLIPYNERLFYDALFSAASFSLDKLAGKHLGGKVGVIAILHTWGQKLQRHVHLHCLVTGGALSHDRKRWTPTSDKQLFDVYELSETFRDRFCHIIRRYFRQDRLKFQRQATYLAQGQAFEALMEEQESQPWTVFCKRPFAGPEKVVEYLGRYSHRVAISNRRIKSIANGRIVFAYKDYRDLDAQQAPKHKEMNVSAETFIQQFLLHVLPKGFRKIRYYGFLGSNQRSEMVKLCRRLIAEQGLVYTDPEEVDSGELPREEPVCPCCGGPLHLKSALKPQRAGPKQPDGQRKVA